MATTREIDLGKFVAGSVRRLRFTLKKDGAAWTTPSAMSLKFEKPDRETTFDRSCTNETTNVWYYDLTTSDLDDEGYWTVGVTITDGSNTVKYPYEIGLVVTPVP